MDNRYGPPVSDICSILISIPAFAVDVSNVTEAVVYRVTWDT